MSANFADHPRINWLLRHLLLEHRQEPDDFDARHVTYLEGFHDGLHEVTDSTTEHDGYSEMTERELDWLISEMGP